MENELIEWAGFDGITKNIIEAIRESFMNAVLLDIELGIKYPMTYIL